MSLKDLINNPIKNVTFNIKSLKDLSELSKFLVDSGETRINIKVNEDNKSVSFQLKNGRKIDRKTVNLLRNREISAIIH